MSALHKLTVLITVYRGGVMFAECLNSLLPHMDCFAHIVVSINKSTLQDEDIATFERFCQQVPDGVTCTCLKQKIELSAKWHVVLLSRQLRHQTFSDYWMSLAHDDILLDGFSRIYKEISFQLNEKQVVNPARSFFRNTFAPEQKIYDYYGMRHFPHGLPVDDFVLQDFDRHYVTNISGLIFHTQSLRRFFSNVKYLYYGYRAEYILMSSLGITTIVSTPEPIIGIRVHPAQQGSIQKPRARQWDEFVYLVHLYRRTTDPLLRQKIRSRSRLLRAWHEPGVYALRLLRKIVRKLFR